MSVLKSSILKEFAKAVSQPKKKTETYIYGTVKLDENNSPTVKFDGSDLYTPVTTSVDISDGQRVLVMIKNHEAVVMSNITEPAVNAFTFKKLEERLVFIVEGIQTGFVRAISEDHGPNSPYAEMRSDGFMVKEEGDIEEVNTSRVTPGAFLAESENGSAQYEATGAQISSNDGLSSTWEPGAFYIFNSNTEPEEGSEEEGYYPDAFYTAEINMGRRVKFGTSGAGNNYLAGIYNEDVEDPEGEKSGWIIQSALDGTVTIPHTLVVDDLVNPSDIRLKKNVVDAELDALGYINKLPVRAFDWKKSGEHWGAGFIADELERIDPLLVNGGGDKMKGIRSFYLMGYLVRAVQELSEEVDRLKEVIESGKVND